MKNGEIFKTNITNSHDAAQVKLELLKYFPLAVINIDFDDPEKILRIEDDSVDSEQITSLLSALGFSCKPIPDKVCKELHNTAEDMEQFWNGSFLQHKAMWGFEPSQSALLAKDLFVKNQITDILLPGFGYGRNAALFLDAGIQVTGIEISSAAIDMARHQFRDQVKVFQASVTEMPLDHHIYGGIFCYGLLYLLDENQRQKMLSDCYEQLLTGGWMFFSVISKNSPNYGKGKQIGENTFELGKGGQLYFYNEDAVLREFASFGLVDFWEIEEKANPASDVLFKFFIVKCQKQSY